MLLCPSTCPPLLWDSVPSEKVVFVFTFKMGNPFISTERGVLESKSTPVVLNVCCARLEAWAPPLGDYRRESKPC